MRKSFELPFDDCLFYGQKKNIIDFPESAKKIYEIQKHFEKRQISPDMLQKSPRIRKV